MSYVFNKIYQQTNQKHWQEILNNLKIKVTTSFKKCNLKLHKWGNWKVELLNINKKTFTWDYSWVTTSIPMSWENLIKYQHTVTFLKVKIPK